MIFEMRDEIKYYKPMIIELNKIFQQANILLIRSVREPGPKRSVVPC